MNPIDIIQALPTAKDESILAEQRLIPAELDHPEREKRRKLPFDNMHNFRELGGFKSATGLCVKWGMVYRADKISGLSDQDQLYLERLKLRKIVDFRSDEERSESPHSILATSNIIIEALPITVDAAQIEKVTARLQQEDVTAEDMAQFLIEANREMIERFAPVYKQWFHSLLDDSSYPQVFHCTAGKDRTGLAAALLLRILGVSADDVMNDYLATNTFTRERIERIVHHINEMTMHQVNEDVVRVLFKVQSRFLNEAYKSIDEHYGNFASFVEIGLGFGEAECGRLRELLLEPAAGI
ncbi:tyrosine-protein phosphatase [Zhongshania sp.]|jgi:protein-tyrosine phosphatase|uniref:tyrosine-protein phosphatase n=1 Tax=Zhongshania sp. TaxID=1971902 RepID=UPI002A826DA2|nr:tyrosine-protein phosphatase [Zhongshania sp.]